VQSKFLDTVLILDENENANKYDFIGFEGGLL